MPNSISPDAHSGRVQHRQALAEARTSALLVALQQKWSALPLADRGDALAVLVSRGCTARGLAADLHCSEGAIRRYLRVARLPAAAIDQIRRGESAKLILDGTFREPHTNTAARSACALREWLDAQKLPATYREQFCEELSRRAWQSREVPRRRLRSIQGLRPRRGRPQYGSDLLEYLLGWSLHWLLTFQPEERVEITRQLR